MKIYKYVIVNKRGHYVLASGTLTTSLKKACLYDTNDDAQYDVDVTQSGQLKERVTRLTFVLDDK